MEILFIRNLRVECYRKKFCTTCLKKLEIKILKNIKIIAY